MLILSGTISSMHGILLKHRQQKNIYRGTPVSGLQTQVNNYNKARQINLKQVQNS